MSETDILPDFTERPYEPAGTTERAAFVKGLRELAAFLEAHPTLPLPVAPSLNAFVYTKEAMAAIARTPGVRWEKHAAGDFFALRVNFSGEHYYDVNVSRSEVCRKVITGTRFVPAQEARQEEITEWVCDGEPLLAGGGR